MDCLYDIVFFVISSDLCLIYICLVVENLFSCLTPFSEMCELRGYILVEISGSEWIDNVHAKMQMIKAFVEKQGLVVDDQSTALNSVALCITLIPEPHTSV